MLNTTAQTGEVYSAKEDSQNFVTEINSDLNQATPPNSLATSRITLPNNLENLSNSLELTTLPSISNYITPNVLTTPKVSVSNHTTMASTINTNAKHNRPPLRFDRAFLQDPNNQLKLVQLVSGLLKTRF